MPMSKAFSTFLRTLKKKTTSRSSQPSTVFSVVSPKAEPQDRYVPGGYHPVCAGEVYNQRYEVIRKLGWGRFSTVWLVRDIRDNSLVAMKVLVGELSNPDSEETWNELGVLKILREHDPRSPGCRHVCSLLDNFTHQGPNGNHICLILEATSLSVFDVYRARRGALPLPLIKRMSLHVLLALKYLHECGIIHTDIKDDNILMGAAPPDKEESTIVVDEALLMSTMFKLSDFGAANLMSNRFAEVIQPESLRAPEVIIGADWDTRTDIWNLGCLIYEFARGSKLFDPHWDNEKSGMSPAQTHLAQISGICGNFPPELLARGKRSNLYFDDQGSLLHGANTYSTSLKSLLSRAGHSRKEIAGLSDFLSRMLVIDPKRRWSAEQLLGHSWLKNVK